MNIITNINERKSVMQLSKQIYRLNVVGGLLFIAFGIVHGMFLAADRDFNVLDHVSHLLRKEVTPTIARSWIELAHAHWGMLGITNIAIGLILPMCTLKEKWRILTSWAGLIGGLLIPLGFVCWILHPALIYLQFIGTLILLGSILFTALSTLKVADLFVLETSARSTSEEKEL